MPTRPRLTRPPRVLVASDQRHALRDLEGALGRQGFSVLRVFAGAAVLERAHSACPDVILLDATLADCEGLELSRRLRADPLIGASTPILLLVTNRPNRQEHLGALRAGVWELVRQPVDPGPLIAKLDAYVTVKAGTERAPDRSLVDELTGLYTRRGLARRAGELMLQAVHHNMSIACVVVAPEGRGEEQGGVNLLRDVARQLHGAARRSDAVGRVGMTEFAVVAPGANRQGARRLAQRLQLALRQSANGDGRGGGGGGLAIELRAGYEAVRQRGADALEPRKLLADATRALELARAEGKWLRQGGRVRAPLQ